MIELKNVTKLYGSKTALDSIDLTLPHGEIVGLFGENGAGKTTLMKCILGYIGFKGEITLDGEPIGRKNIENLSFATSEHSYFPSLSAKGHREFYAQHFPNFSHQRFLSLMDFFELPMNKNIGSFSTGQKNQFEVIMALSQGARYILMDEPFAGNDIFNREDFYKVLLGILRPDETVILSTHLLEEVSAFISRAVLIRKGRLVGDITTEQLDAQGSDLISYIKQTYNYRADRVSKTINELAGEE